MTPDKCRVGNEEVIRSIGKSEPLGAHCEAEPLLTAEQIGLRVGRHWSTILKWGRDGIIPREVLTARWVRFYWSKVEAALDKNRIKVPR